MRAIGVLVGLMVVFLLVGLLATAFTSAQANLVAAQALRAEAQASQFQALSGLLGQCFSLVITVLALVAGFWVGSKTQAIKGHLQERTKSKPGHWVSGPNAGWKQLNTRPRQKLTEGELLSQLLQIELERRQQAALRLPEPESIEVEDNEDDDWEDYKDWGW